MAAGDFKIMRNASNVDAIPSYEHATNTLTALYDTAVDNEGSGITYSSGVFTLGETGKFLVMVSEEVGDTAQSSGIRQMVKARLKVAGTIQEKCGQNIRYLRNFSSLSGIQSVSLIGIVDIATTTGNGDDIEVILDRADNVTSGTTDPKRIGGRSGITILKLDDAWNYAKYSLSADQALSSTDDTETRVLFDTKDSEESPFTLTTSGANEGCVDVATNNWVLAIYQLYGDMTSGYSRGEWTSRMRKDATGTPVNVPGTGNEGYMRSVEDTKEFCINQMSLLNPTSGDDFDVTCTFHSTLTTIGCTLDSTKCVLWFIELPAATAAALIEATTGDFNPASATNFAWDTGVKKDTGLTYTNGNANVDVTDAGDYLVMATQKENNDTDSGTDRQAPLGYFRYNTTDILHASASSYDRDDETYKAGYCVAAIANAVPASASLYVRNERLEGQGGACTCDEGQFGVVKLSSLFVAVVNATATPTKAGSGAAVSATSETGGATSTPSAVSASAAVSATSETGGATSTPSAVSASAAVSDVVETTADFPESVGGTAGASAVATTAAGNVAVSGVSASASVSDVVETTADFPESVGGTAGATALVAVTAEVNVAPSGVSASASVSDVVEVTADFPESVGGTAGATALTAITAEVNVAPAAAGVTTATNIPASSAISQTVIPTTVSASSSASSMAIGEADVVITPPSAGALGQAVSYLEGVVATVASVGGTGSNVSTPAINVVINPIKLATNSYAGVQGLAAIGGNISTAVLVAVRAVGGASSATAFNVSSVATPAAAGGTAGNVVSASYGVTTTPSAGATAAISNSVVTGTETEEIATTTSSGASVGTLGFYTGIVEITPDNPSATANTDGGTYLANSYSVIIDSVSGTAKASGVSAITTDTSGVVNLASAGGTSSATVPQDILVSVQVFDSAGAVGTAGVDSVLGVGNLALPSGASADAGNSALTASQLDRGVYSTTLQFPTVGKYLREAESQTDVSTAITTLGIQIITVTVSTNDVDWLAGNKSIEVSWENNGIPVKLGSVTVDDPRLYLYDYTGIDSGVTYFQNLLAALQAGPVRFRLGAYTDNVTYSSPAFINEAVDLELKVAA